MIRTCAKCQGTMIEGFTLDLSHSGAYFTRWIEGEPSTSVWAGGVKTKGHDCRAIQTFRCERCGYLESYASQPTPAPSWNQQ